MKAEIIRDSLAVAGFVSLVGGLWFEFGPGFAGIIGGGTVLVLAIASALRGPT